MSRSRRRFASQTRLVRQNNFPYDATRKRRRLLAIEALSSRLVLNADLPIAFASAESSIMAEGEPGDDLVAFAKSLTASGATLYGADWSASTTSQLELFDDAASYLNFVEATLPDRQLNDAAVQAGISILPTWLFADGSKLEGVQSLAQLSQVAGVPIVQANEPSFVPVADQQVLTSSPLHIPIDAYSPHGRPLTVTVTSSDPTVIAAEVLQGSRSVRVDVEDRGQIIFELFESESKLATDRIVELIENGFYDQTATNEIIFHRVIDNFVIQTGDPTGTGTGSSSLPDVDDVLDVDLQYNRTGIVGMAKAGNDSGNSQFFITEGSQRHLDLAYSVIGQVVEGERVRNGISRTAVQNSKPVNDVVINSMSVFQETENALVRLTAIPGKTGTAAIQVTVTDSDGFSTSQTFNATIGADTSNSPPFLNPIAEDLQATAQRPLTLQLTSQDAEGDAPIYRAFGVSPSNAATLTVNSQTGNVVVTPSAGFVGTFQFTAGVVQDTATTGGTAGNDTQVVQVTVAQETLSDMAVSLSSVQSTVTAGQQLGLFVVVSNFGPGVANGVTAVLQLPSALTFVSGSGPLGTVAVTNGQLTMTVGSMNPGTSATYSINTLVSTTASGRLTATVIVNSTNTDPVTVNNIDVADVFVEGTQRFNINGYVYVDTNNDGDRFVDVGTARLAHQGIPNVVVQLEDVNGTVLQRTTTDANGFYMFSNIATGLYLVSEVQPLAFLDGIDTPGTPFINGSFRNDSFGFFLNSDAVNFNFGEIGLIPPLIKKNMTLASTPAPSELLGMLAANNFGEIRVPRNGVLQVLRSDAAGAMQVLNAEGELVAATVNGLQLDISAAEGEQLFVYSASGYSLQYVNATSPTWRLDVNGDNVTTPLDVLTIINGLNRLESIRSVPELIDRIDVNRDGQLTPLDALLIVNALNHSRSLEGEGEMGQNDARINDVGLNVECMSSIDTDELVKVRKRIR